MAPTNASHDQKAVLLDLPIEQIQKVTITTLLLEALMKAAYGAAVRLGTVKGQAYEMDEGEAVTHGMGQGLVGQAEIATARP